MSVPLTECRSCNRDLPLGVLVYCQTCVDDDAHAAVEAFRAALGELLGRVAELEGAKARCNGPFCQWHNCSDRASVRRSLASGTTYDLCVVHALEGVGVGYWK